MDVFLDEADPGHWPGQGIKVGAMDAKTRGDLYWVRKTAASAAALYLRVQSMVARTQHAGEGTTPAAGEVGEGEDGEPAEMDREIAQYEREAAKLIDDAQNKSRKAAFDAKTHGKG